jgi:hypothetical protein
MASMYETQECPKCGASLRGDPIPERSQSIYGSTHFSNVIGVQYAWDDPNHYDGVSEWRCPHCGYREGRWSGRALGPNETEPPFGRSR